MSMAHSNKDPMSYLNVRSSVLHAPLDLRTEIRSIRPPDLSELQISIRSTGLCGSDLHYYNHFRNGDIQCLEPLTLGHESVGVVVDVGSAIAKGEGRGKWKIGDKVALEVGLPCKICERCKEGRYNICPDIKFRSSAKGYPHAQGTLQERINHPVEFCYKLPADLPFEMGALLEPLSVAIHASRRAALKENSTILVFGAGAVGLLVAATMKVEGGAKKVVIADIDPGRVDFAVQNGFADYGYIAKIATKQSTTEELEHSKVMAKEIGHLVSIGTHKNEVLVDAVFECTGAPSCLQSAIYTTRPGGKIMLIGMGTPIQTLPISAAALREIDILGVFRYANAYPQGIQLLSNLLAEQKTANQPTKKLPDIRKLVTHRFEGFDRIEDGFKMAGRTVDADGNLVIKVVVEFAEGDGVSAKL